MVGITESKEAIASLKVLIDTLKTVGGEGSLLKKVEALVAALPAVKRGVDGGDKIPAEMADLDIAEIKELVSLLVDLVVELYHAATGAKA